MIRKLALKKSTYVFGFLFIMFLQKGYSHNLIEQDAMFMHQIEIDIDGYKDMYKTITADLYVTLIEYKGSDEDRQIIDKHTLETDEDGYYFLRTKDVDQNFEIKKVRIRQNDPMKVNSGFVTIEPESISKQLNIRVAGGLPTEITINEDGSGGISSGTDQAGKDLQKMMNHAMIQLNRDDPWFHLLKKSLKIYRDDQSIHQTGKEQVTYYNIKESEEPDISYDNCSINGKFYREIEGWLSDSSNTKEDNVGSPFIMYMDSDNQTSENPYEEYDFVHLHRGFEGTIIVEQFQFTSKTGAKVNYTLKFFNNPEEGHWGDCDNLLVKKTIRDITPQKAGEIGSSFKKRLSNIYSGLGNFSRLNYDPLDQILRKEDDAYWTEFKNGKIKSPGFPIYDYLEDKKIAKLEEFIDND